MLLNSFWIELFLVGRLCVFSLFCPKSNQFSAPIEIVIFVLTIWLPYVYVRYIDVLFVCLFLFSPLFFLHINRYTDWHEWYKNNTVDTRHDGPLLQRRITQNTRTQATPRVHCDCFTMTITECNGMRQINAIHPVNVINFFFRYMCLYHYHTHRHTHILDFFLREKKGEGIKQTENTTTIHSTATNFSYNIVHAFLQSHPHE